MEKISFCMEGATYFGTLVGSTLSSWKMVDVMELRQGYDEEGLPTTYMLQTAYQNRGEDPVVQHISRRKVSMWAPLTGKYLDFYTSKSLERKMSDEEFRMAPITADVLGATVH